MPPPLTALAFRCAARSPVFHYGPFVMNTKDEVVQAMQDFQAGRLGTIPAQEMPHLGFSPGVP